ncbi:MAG: Asp-tRNA(Asn)/Glu-tRNA(Gln) amidotransferase subunit GatC [Candidatus Moranbacteria bacterium]|nr:Asp-tRNA(Asn)/Glu-tRNA(Gln) amidotransferase subunit GatC [Candidatus Moranbacteria bacterium]
MTKKPEEKMPNAKEVLSKNDVIKIADLARIGITDEECEKYQKDLGQVLNFFQELEKIDTENVEEVGHITGMENVMRSDKEYNDSPKEGKERQAIMRNIPKTKDRYVQVPKVL